MKNKIYIIEGKTYLNHINDEVHLYGLLHQLPQTEGGREWQIKQSRIFPWAALNRT